MKNNSVPEKYAKAIKEVITYLKGIREEDINKIPEKMMKFLEENASKDYNCNIDYTKPLNELELMDETKGIIGLICYNYWCETQEQKEKFLNNLKDNEKKYQEELKKKYDLEKVFARKNNKLLIIEEPKKLKWYQKIFKILLKRG